MDIKSVKDMQNLGKSKNGETESYDPPKYLVQPHEGDQMYPFAEKEYLRAKKDSMESGSPLITTSYKKFDWHHCERNVRPAFVEEYKRKLLSIIVEKTQSILQTKIINTKLSY